MAQQLKLTGDLESTFQDSNDIRKDRKYFERALKLCRQRGDIGGEVLNLESLGLIYLEENCDEKAEKCFLDSLTICRQIGDRFGEARLMYRLGTVCTYSGDIDTAVYYFQEGLSHIGRNS